MKEKYIVDNNNRKIAVQLDIQTFRKIEDILEKLCVVPVDEGG